jgi:hypothetical protein
VTNLATCSSYGFVLARNESRARCHVPTCDGERSLAKPTGRPRIFCSDGFRNSRWRVDGKDAGRSRIETPDEIRKRRRLKVMIVSD